MTENEEKLINLMLSDDAQFPDVESLKAAIRKERMSPECLKAVGRHLEANKARKLNRQAELQQLVDTFGQGAVYTARAHLLETGPTEKYER